MKINIGKISKISFGLILIGLLIASIGIWEWSNTGFFTHGMYQGHSIMSYGINFWGAPLVIGAFLLFIIGAVFMTQNSSENNTKELPLCVICGEELIDPDWEVCPFCGEQTKEK